MMNALFLRMAAVVGAAALLGCNSQFATRQQLTQQMAQATSEAADLLATVQDKASAAAAAPKLRELMVRMTSLGEQFEALEMEDEIYLGQENEAILTEHAKYIAAHVKLMQEQQRIGANQELREGLGDVWQELTAGMYDPGGPLGPGGQFGPGGTLPASATPAR
jgi:hypothetical protein